MNHMHGYFALHVCTDISQNSEVRHNVVLKENFRIAMLCIAWVLIVLICFFLLICLKEQIKFVPQTNSGLTSK